MISFHEKKVRKIRHRDLEPKEYTFFEKKIISFGLLYYPRFVTGMFRFFIIPPST